MVSPKVRIIALFGCDVPATLVVCAEEKAGDKKILEISNAQIMKNLLTFELNIVVMFRYTP
jgi:hypothetical protein